jgi:hypothetical protein
MVLRVVGGIRTGEDTEDLRAFLSHLEGSPTVSETVVLGCGNHGDERPTWTYVEADPANGVARRRCLQCATNVWVLDSEERWTFPHVWACGSCGQSICEVAAGLALSEDEQVSWVVLGARCCDCGRIDGLTDLVLPGTPLPEVMGRL